MTEKLEIIRNSRGRYEIRRPATYGDGYSYYSPKTWWTCIEYRYHATKFWTLWGAKRVFNRLQYVDKVVFP